MGAVVANREVSSHPAGTLGKLKVAAWLAVATLLARLQWSLLLVADKSSKSNCLGSPDWVCQRSVTVSPDSQPEGVSRTRALATETRDAARVEQVRTGMILVYV